MSAVHTRTRRPAFRRLIAKPERTIEPAMLLNLPERNLADLRGTQLDLRRSAISEHALESSLTVVDRRVDDVVVFDLDAPASAIFGHAFSGTNVETDDDRVVDGRQVS